MNIDEWVQEFYEFLVKHGALLNYLKYTTFEEAKKHVLHTRKLNRFLISSLSFPWSGTDEGYSYWKELCSKWDQYIENKKLLL